MKEFNKYRDASRIYDARMSCAWFTRYFGARKLPELLHIAYQNAVCHRAGVKVDLRPQGWQNYRHAYTVTPDGQVVDVINKINLHYIDTQHK